MKEHLLGVKLGSERTVVYGKDVAPLKDGVWGPRQELTCVHQVPSHLLRDEFKYRFSNDADPYDGVIYMLQYGLPRDDAEVPLIKSTRLLKFYTEWLLKDAAKETGVVFCLPMMRHDEGLNQLKAVLEKIERGKIGKRYIAEAWAAAIATIGIEESLDSQVVSMNFGSSTLEVALYTGRTLIAQNVYPFGGWDLDRDLSMVISQAHRGITVTERQTRLVKERYNYAKPKAIDGAFTKDGRTIEVQVQPETINPVLEKFATNVAKAIASQFLPTAASGSAKAVSSIQTEGLGYFCICGGLSCMPGFAELIQKKLVEEKAVNESIEFRHPENPDGVSAPAWGAYMMAELLDEERSSSDGKTW